MMSEQKNHPEGFFKKEYRRLVSYVRSLIHEVGERDEEDIIQDVMLSLFNRIEITGPVEDLSAYVYSSLRNRIIDHYKKRREANVSDDRIPLVDLRETPDDSLEKAELHGILDRAIATLPPPMRSVFLLIEGEGLTHREAALELEIPIGTALTLNREAKRRLRHELKDYR